MRDSGIQRQRTIFIAGIAGNKPAVPIDYDKLEKQAFGKMSKEAFAYIAGGAGLESTISENRRGFDRWKICPRMLKDVGVRDTQISLFNRLIPSPFLLAPIGVLEMAHHEADLAVARAAAKHDIPFIFSNQASFSMERCAAVMDNHPFWFQLYWSKNKDLVASFVQRAEACGASALAVTLDTTLLGWRTRDLDLAYLPFLRGKGIAQYVSDPVFQRLLEMEEDEEADNIKPKINLSAIRTFINIIKAYPGKSLLSKLKSRKPMAAVKKFISIYSNPSLSWEDLSFLRDHTKLPILLKGILHPDDALKAIDFGMDGVIVSNHGGRQIDGAVSTASVLPEIVKATQKKIKIIVDSGIRGGSDIFKALALGADAACIGRPYVYALAIGGEAGVSELISNYKADFDLCMGLAGCKSISEITAESVRPS